jgi:anhydro-N-acetylmuramic acid kinase
MSYREGETRIAFDICALNVVMNKFARSYGKEFDENGNLAKTGQFIPDLFDELNTLPYYTQSYPKSLGTEWVDSELMPIIDRFNASDQDKLATFTEHAASQISKCISIPHLQKVLITGGGAWNSFLVDRLTKHCNATIVVPERNLVEHKESLIFALLGLLRLEEKSNTLNSVTGASRTMCSGAVYFP